MEDFHWKRWWSQSMKIRNLPYQPFNAWRLVTKLLLCYPGTKYIRKQKYHTLQSTNIQKIIFSLKSPEKHIGRKNQFLQVSFIIILYSYLFECVLFSVIQRLCVQKMFQLKFYQWFWRGDFYAKDCRIHWDLDVTYIMRFIVDVGVGL